MKKAGFLLLLVGLLFGCQKSIDIVAEPVKGDLFLVQNANNKAPEPVIVANLLGQNLVANYSEEQLKSFYAYITPNKIATISFEKVDGDYTMRGFDGSANYYYDLELMNNSLYLLNSFSGCSGCGFCIMSSATSCSCNESSGSCSYSSGSVK